MQHHQARHGHRDHLTPHLPSVPSSFLAPPSSFPDEPLWAFWRVSRRMRQQARWGKGCLAVFLLFVMCSCTGAPAAPSTSAGAQQAPRRRCSATALRQLLSSLRRHRSKRPPRCRHLLLLPRRRQCRPPFPRQNRCPHAHRLPRRCRNRPAKPQTITPGAILSRQAHLFPVHRAPFAVTSPVSLRSGKGVGMLSNAPTGCTPNREAAPAVALIMEETGAYSMPTDGGGQKEGGYYYEIPSTDAIVFPDVFQFYP